ncbi:MAG TPA: 3-carboxy-cis,cis-muconate cycloisomerase [Candidatus Sulfotelmatobacter sp.]|nr:3-carboxy-cis,cis-muconate cycloisomerase [Candidatus Sulfotelmatobacter sp.]
MRQDELFGELYGTAAMRAIFSARNRVAKMLAFEVALARAEGAAGVIPGAAADAIAAAADPERIDLTALAASAQNVGYPVVPLTKQLAALTGTDAGGYVHWGATTQDVLDTATVLQLRDAVTLLEADLSAVVAALTARAQTHRDDLMVGRTHLQHALPVTFGYVCATWLAPLLSGRERLRAAAERARVVQFGGAVGTLASLGTRGRDVTLALARELDLAAPDAPWHVDRSRIVDLAAAIALVCGSLATIATDVMLLMQTEVAEVFEPQAPGRGGSSAMPHKRNPIACEYVLAAARGVDALLPTLLAAMPGDHQRSTGPWQSEEIALPELVVLASAAFAQARALTEGMTVDTARMRRNLDLTGGLIVSEAVAMALAEKIGAGPAHTAVEAAAARALDEQVAFLDALAADATIAAVLDRASLERLLDPAGYLGEAGAVVDRVTRSRP